MLAGTYRVERLLGRGATGIVVAAHHIALDQPVALKFLRPELASHAEASGRFLREARAAVRIKSQHVVRVFDVGTLDGRIPYVAMERLVGRDLASMVKTGGVLGIADAVDYVIQACEALAEAHSLGIIHRDVKPANLFMTRRPNGLPLIKVLDFGISEVVAGEVGSLTRTDASMGSAPYMSPEQMQQTRSVDHRTDIYALGVTLYELLAGSQPFRADTLPQLRAAIFTGTPTPLREHRPQVPEGLAAVPEKAYARDRDARYPSIGALVVALARYAPTRSQGVVDSIARMAGLDAPVVGALAETAVLP